MGDMIPGSFKDGFEGGRGFFLNTKGENLAREGGFGGGASGFQTDM